MSFVLDVATRLSRIDGTLASSIPGADLFLLNPNGVVVGQTGSLDVMGSFYVATSDSLRFANGSELVVDEIDDPVLSTFPPVAFGFLPGDAGDVTFPLTSPAINTQPIQVGQGSTLSVVAGNVRLDSRGSFRAPGGTIQLAGVGRSGVEVPVDVSELDASGVAALGHVHIGDNANVLALDGTDSNAPQGRVVIRGESLSVERAFVVAGGDDTPGSLAIDVQLTGAAVIDDGSGVQAFAGSAATTGGFRLSADRVQLSDSSLAGAQSVGAGDGEAVVVTTRTLEVSTGSRHVQRPRSDTQYCELQASDNRTPHGRGKPYGFGKPLQHLRPGWQHPGMEREAFRWV